MTQHKEEGNQRDLEGSRPKAGPRLERSSQPLPPALRHRRASTTPQTRAASGRPGAARAERRRPRAARAERRRRAPRDGHAPRASRRGGSQCSQSWRQRVAESKKRMAPPQNAALLRIHQPSNAAAPHQGTPTSAAAHLHESGGACTVVGAATRGFDIVKGACMCEHTAASRRKAHKPHGACI
jgi:hypothetical protein